MKTESAERFSREVDSYRSALLFYARNSDWAEFKEKAGRFFDYVESIEFHELERKFYNIFNGILMALAIAVIVLFGVDFTVHREWSKLRDVFILAALAGGSFELYFFLNYRGYTDTRSFYYRKRREKFIRAIEQDFRSYILRIGQEDQPDMRMAA